MKRLRVVLFGGAFGYYTMHFDNAIEIKKHLKEYNLSRGAIIRMSIVNGFEAKTAS